MSCGAERKNTASQRHASAAGRGSPWWWRAFTRVLSCAKKKLNHREPRGTQGRKEGLVFPVHPCETSVLSVVKGFRMNIKKVGVLGCGLMGSGIAQVCATAGFDVTVLEVEQKYLDKGFAGIEKSLAKFGERPVEKGGITAQQKDAIRGRLKGTTNKADLADCDII